MATDRIKEALQLAISPLGQTLAVRHQLRRHLHHPAASLNLHVKEATSLPHPPDDDNGNGHNQNTPLFLPIHLPHVPLFASRLGQTILCLRVGALVAPARCGIWGWLPAAAFRSPGPLSVTQWCGSDLVHRYCGPAGGIGAPCSPTWMWLGRYLSSSGFSLVVGCLASTQGVLRARQTMQGGDGDPDVDAIPDFT